MTSHTHMRTEIRQKSGDKKLFALVLDLSDIEEGTYPATDPSWSIQLLLMKRKQGHVVAKHAHKKLTKSTSQPQEALVIIRGEAEASIFDNEGAIVEKVRVVAGQCLLILDGSHEVLWVRRPDSCCWKQQREDGFLHALDRLYGRSECEYHNGYALFG